MKTKCDGCGAKIQTTNPNEKGYIKSEVYLKNPDNFLCERCFNILHYNKNTNISLNEDEFKEQITKINKTGDLVVYVVDTFDLEGTIIKNINQLFNNNKILLVLNKYDLFLSSTNSSKLLSNIKEYLRENNIIVDGITLISAKKQDDIIRLLNKIYRLIGKSENCFLFGATNVGKSSIVNGIINACDEKNNEVVVSSMPGTTLGMIKINLPEGKFIYDTAGIINNHQITKYLSIETVNKVIPKKFVRPTVFQLDSNQTIFIGGFASISVYNECSLVCYFSNQIPLHRTKESNKDGFIKKHLKDILLLPTELEYNILNKNGTVTHDFTIKNPTDICISGLGFITIKSDKEINIKVECYKDILITERKALI